jgi:hypothetical protein
MAQWGGSHERSLERVRRLRGAMDQLDRLIRLFKVDRGQ